MMRYVVLVLAGYLCGCFNLAFLLAKTKGTSIASVGNGNPGASNVTLNYGIKFGAAVALSDILKALVPGIAAGYLFPELPNAVVLTGCASVIGHMFPFYMRFKGGKGFASYIGMCFAVDWRVALAVLAVALIMAFAADYIVAATFTMIGAAPWAVALFDKFVPACIMLGVSLLILVKHFDNIQKMAHGKEPLLSSVWKKPSNK